jgi:hypothetical protein
MNNSTPYNFTQLNPWDYADTNCINIMKIWNFLQYEHSEYSYYWDESIYQSIIQGFEAVKNGSLKEPPMNQDFWDWTANDTSLKWRVGEVGFDKCDKDLCKAIGWVGSPDIAGVGVSTMLGMLMSTKRCANWCRCWPHISYKVF